MSCAKNIVTAFFNGGRTATTAPLYQWDYGQVLRISGLTLPAAFQVHFSNSPRSGTTTTSIGQDGQVTIPDVYLTKGLPVYAFIFLHNSEDDGETEYVITIPVNARPQPTDEEPTPEQQSEINQLIDALNNGVERAETAADSAEASATASQASADESAGSATTAAQKASEAATSAGNAAQSAQTAAQSAIDAAASATESAQSAADADTSADRAEQSATAAAASATAASGSASDSAASATAAEGFAGNASTAAGNASQAAQSASQSATAAAGSATAAGQSATTATAQATTAANQAIAASQSATAAAGSATAAGASATAAQTAQTAAETAQTAAEDAQAAAEAAAQTLVIDPTLTQPNQAAEAKATGDAIDAVNVQLGAALIVNEASGAIATFPDGSDDVPVKSLTVGIKPSQDLHGLPYPYPAGGSANLIPDGTNTENGYIGGAYLNADGSTTSGATTYVSEYFPVTVGETYTWSCNVDAVNPCMCFYDADKNYISGVTSNHKLPKTFTAPINAAYARSSQYTVLSGNILQLEIGSTATTPMRYSNICPISGYDSAGVYRSVYNLLDQSIVLRASGWALSTDEGFETYEGVPVYNGTSYALANYFTKTNPMPLSVDPSKRYVIAYWWRSVGEHAKAGLRMAVLYSDGTEDLTGTQSANLTWTRRILATYEGKVPVGIRFAYNSNYAIYLAGLCCVEYEQYIGMGDDRLTFVCPGDRTAVTIPLGDTIYGGSLDVVSGVMTVTHKLHTFNSGDLTVSETSTATKHIFSSYRPSDFAPTTVENWAKGYKSNILSLSARGTSGSAIVNGSIYGGATYLSIRLDSVPATQEGIDALLTATPLQIYAPLVSPVTVQLVGQSLTTLKGRNNIWSDAGDVSVDYVADTKLFIEQLTEPDADMIADSNITSGQYFMVGNALFLATANIASGASIVPGVNCTRTNLAAALNAINA